MKITLNLIPPSNKKKIVIAQRLKLIFSVELTLAIIIVGFFVVLLSFQYILNFNDKSYKLIQKNSKDAVQLNELEKYNTQFKKINTQISLVSLIDKDQLYWSRLLIRLDTLISPSIKLDSLATDNYGVVLRGVANNRDELINFKKQLENETELMNINLPLSNLVDKDNIKFQISFSVKKDYLKNK